MYPILTQVGGGDWTKTTGVRFVNIYELVAIVPPRSPWLEPDPTTPEGRRRHLARVNWDVGGGGGGGRVYNGGTLLARFSEDDWDEEKDGFIYEDDTWLESLQWALRNQGFSADAVRAIDYSEQGMQGGGQVDMDVGPNFLRAWRDRFGHKSFKEY